MKTLKLILVSLLLLPALLLFYSPKTSAFDLFQESCKNASGSSVCQDAQNSDTKNNNAVLRGIKTAANIIATITGIYAVAMIIAGGFSIVTSAGKADQVAAGRRRILYSLLGLVVVALAWTLTTVIINLVS